MFQDWQVRTVEPTRVQNRVAKWIRDELLERPDAVEAAAIETPRREDWYPVAHAVNVPGTEVFVTFSIERDGDGNARLVDLIEIESIRDVADGR